MGDEDCFSAVVLEPEVYELFCRDLIHVVMRFNKGS